MVLGFIKKIWNFFTGVVSDEEFSEMIKGAVQCPNCGIFIDPDVYEDMKHVCPKCKTKFDKILNDADKNSEGKDE